MAERTSRDDPPAADAVTTRPPIPADLAARGYHWTDCGFLASADGLLIIARPEPFAVAREVEGARARLAETRKPKQERMELDV